MTKARQATTTVTFVDEYGERYQDLFPDVCSFEQFKYVLVVSWLLGISVLKPGKTQSWRRPSPHLRDVWIARNMN
jgi:hypothetical protein